MRKWGGKLKGILINEKFPKLDEKIKKKTNHLLFLQKVKNLRNLARKIKRKTKY